MKIRSLVSACFAFVAAGNVHADITGVVTYQPPSDPQIPVPGITVEANKFNPATGYFEPKGTAVTNDVTGSYTISLPKPEDVGYYVVVANSGPGAAKILTPWDRYGQFYDNKNHYGVGAFGATSNQPPLFVVESRSETDIILSARKVCSVEGGVVVDGMVYNGNPAAPALIRGNKTFTTFDNTVYSTDLEQIKNPMPFSVGNPPRSYRLTVTYALRNNTDDVIGPIQAKPIAFITAVNGSQSITQVGTPTPLSSGLAKGALLQINQNINIPETIWNELSNGRRTGEWVTNVGFQFNISNGNGAPACETLIFPVVKGD